MRVLVVDDFESIRHVCERTLRRDGHDVASCASGVEAVGRLAEGWDLILTDVVLPGGISGNELLRRARAESGADVILMTAYPALDSAITALKDGCYDYLVKPFQCEALLGAVRRCQEKRSLSRELGREKRLRAELDVACRELFRMRKLQQTFGQFATPEVAQFVLEQPESFRKRGERRSVTVLFADVRDFTSYVGRVEPEEAVLSLNEVLSYVIDPIQAEGGIVNKFLGDGLMAVFGAPLPHPDHAQAAARAALRARDAVEALAVMRRGLQLPCLRLGFGINTGEVVAGFLGTAERTEYGVIGHTVNVAARLQAAAGPGQIFAGCGTAGLLGDAFSVGEAFLLRPKGLPEPLPATEISWVSGAGLRSAGARQSEPQHERA